MCCLLRSTVQKVIYHMREETQAVFTELKRCWGKRTNIVEIKKRVWQSMNVLATLGVRRAKTTWGPVQQSRGLVQTQRHRAYCCCPGLLASPFTSDVVTRKPTCRWGNQQPNNKFVSPRCNFENCGINQVFRTYIYTILYIKHPGGGNGNPLQYSCLENPHRQRSLVGYSPQGRKGSDTTEATQHACVYKADNEQEPTVE